MGGHTRQLPVRLIVSRAFRCVPYMSSGMTCAQVRVKEDCCFNVEGPFGEVEITCWSSRIGAGWVEMPPSHQPSLPLALAGGSSREDAAVEAGEQSAVLRCGMACGEGSAGMQGRACMG